MLVRPFHQLRKFCAKASGTYYVTTPIFYVNAAPHIGHLYSAVIADTICRYRRLQATTDSKIHLCTGTDEHGTKIQQAAAANNVPVAQYCDNISLCYRNVFQQANIQHTDFIRTSEERHKEAVSNFWRLLKERGHIYSAQYSGWYCVSDETFLTESQLRVDNETGNRFSLESGHCVEWSEETNYMFCLSSLQEEVVRWVNHENRIRPAKFKKILLDTLSEPLPDISVSRPANRVHWAIPVPEDQTQTVYVWLDALINYLTSTGYPDNKFSVQWPPRVQIIGKDILKFHGIYWPAFLMAAGLEPPHELFVHSHWTVDGQKMSKSKNNVVNPIEAAKLYSMEGLRYFLLREGVAHSDGNYSNVKAMRILNSELADTLGNLLSRACARSLNPKQVFPECHESQFAEILRSDAGQRLAVSVQQLEERCRQHYEENNFYLIVDAVMATLHAANNFFETAQPWKLKSDNNRSLQATTAEASTSGDGVGQRHIENSQKLETIIAITMDTLRMCGIILQPIVPQLSGRLLDKLSVPQDERLWGSLNQNFTNNETSTGKNRIVERSLSNSDAVLFRRIQPKDLEEFDKPQQLKPSQQPLQPDDGKMKSTKPKRKSTKTHSNTKTTTTVKGMVDKSEVVQ